MLNTYYQFNNISLFKKFYVALQNFVIKPINVQQNTVEFNRSVVDLTC